MPYSRILTATAREQGNTARFHRTTLSATYSTSVYFRRLARINGGTGAREQTERAPKSSNTSYVLRGCVADTGSADSLGNEQCYFTRANSSYEMHLFMRSITVHSGAPGYEERGLGGSQAQRKTR